MMRAGRLAGILLLLCCVIGCRSFGPSEDDKYQQLLLGDHPRRDVIRILHPNADLRRWSVLNLGRQGDPISVDAMLLLLNETVEPSPLVRSTAAVALRMIGDKRAVPALMKAASDPNPLVRADVVSALGALGGPEQVGRLIEILKRDADVEVRLQAVGALARIGGDEALSALIVQMTDFDESVAFACHYALINVTGQDLPPRVHLWREWLAGKTTSEG